MKNFWQDLPKPFFILAPMDAVTDVVFRHVIAQAAPADVYFTEFTNTDSYCSPKGQHSTKGRLAFTADEQPMVAHIWGKNPEHFREMAFGMREMGFVGIDINTGCPAKDVVKTGGGSGLIRTPELAAEIIQATKEAGLPVSVKARLGDIRIDEWEGWLTNILNQDIANLTIHLRTRKEMSKVPAHYELIPEIKKLRDRVAPQTTLTINGDIRDRAHGMELIEKYGVDGVMIGRGVFTNPFAFELEPKQHTREEFINLLKLQLDLFDKFVAEFGPKPFDTLKRFFKIYIRDFEDAAELRDKLMHTKSTAEVRELLKSPL